MELQREQLAQFSVVNHKNAKNNPNAQFPFEISVDKVINSTVVADPLTLLDCSPVSDGAAAVVMVPAEDAKNTLILNLCKSICTGFRNYCIT